MKVDSVAPATLNTNTNRKKHSLINVKNTGYVAVAGMGLATLSGVTKSRFLMKNHKVFAGISLVSVIAHLYLIIGGRKNKTKP